MDDRGVERQRRELDELRAEVSRLREELRALTRAGRTDDVDTKSGLRSESTAPVVGRRSMLGRAALVAAGGLGVALAAQSPAAAGIDGDVVLGTDNDAGTETTEISSSSEYGTLVCLNSGKGGAILGFSDDADALRAVSQNKRGVYAVSQSDVALYAQSRLQTSVHATILEVSNTHPTMYGDTAGTGNAIYGQQSNTSITGDTGPESNGVLGIARGSGKSVFGYKPDGVDGDAVVGQADSGVGVKGISGSGRGGVFQSSTRAQVRLIPSTLTNHPASGSAGDLFLDKTKRLWFCKGTTSWVQIG